MSISLVARKRRIDNENTQPTRGARQSSLHAQEAVENVEPVADASTSRQAKRPKRSNENHRSTQSQGSIARGAFSQSQLLAEVPRCGKIGKIVLENFMCHAHLCIDLYDRVNFLVGSNGSGKSAILAALVVGLGAPARATNRSGALQKLIKTGENTSKIHITISNDGPEAFEPEVYGKQITVVRSISQTSTAYKIKSANGNVVSKKATDLQNILMYHNIQVENPVFIMNQDSAREFLKEMEPKKNYTLFLKATQLELIQDTLTKCHYEYEGHVKQIQNSKQKLILQQQKISQAKAKWEQLLSFAQSKNELNQKRLEYAWLQVAKKEHEFQKLLQTINKYEEKIKEISNIPREKHAMETKYSEEINKYKSEMNLKQAEYDAVNSECKSIEGKLSNDMQNCQKIDYGVINSKKRIGRLETQIADLRKNIDERSNNMGIAELRQSNDNKLRELRKQQTDTTAMIESVKRDYSIFANDKMQNDEKCNNIKHRIQELKSSISARQDEINNLKRNSTNSLSIYGEDVYNLLMEIERQQNAGKFSAPPRGPIGRYIEVPNAKYRNVVENQIRGLLQGFIVNNKQDRLLLEHILKQKCPNYNPTIITMKFLNQMYDVRRGCVRPPAGTRLLLDVIKCDDPVTMNCLIDQLQIETILVTDTKEVAERFTMQQEQVPQNLKKIIVLQPSMEYYPDPKYRMYSLAIHPARYIQVNVNDRIKQLEADAKGMLNQIKTLNAELAALEKQLFKVEQCLKEKKLLLNRHKERNIELQQSIDELAHFEYPDSNDIDILQNELNDNQHKLEEFHQQLSGEETKLRQARSQKVRTENELKERKSKMDIIRQEIRNIEDKEQELQKNLSCLTEQSQRCEAKLAQLNEQLQTLESRKDSEVKALAAATKEAKKLGERRDTERTEEEILNDIKTKEAHLRHGEKIDENPELLRQQIESMEHTMEANRYEYKTMKLVIEQLRQSQHKRKNFLERFKRHMVVMLQYSFNQVLSMRKFKGSIEADHKNRTLCVSVVPRDNNIDGAVSNTRSLSGGERSYTTVAFLISLWSCVDHPFFFLDEYDVFTDDVNREYMTRLLLNEGQKRPNRQYTFLTPQDMSLQSQDFIRIHRLAEPNRR